MYCIPVVQIGFNPTLYSADEDAGEIVFIVQNGNPNSERDVTVQFSTLDGTAGGTYYFNSCITNNNLFYLIIIYMTL